METGHGAAEGIRSGRGEQCKRVASTGAHWICQGGALHLSTAASMLCNLYNEACGIPPFVLPTDRCLAMGPGC